MAAIRAAVMHDAAAIRRIVHAAYAPYIARIGRQPAPMLDDYRARIAAAQAWVAEDAGRVAGVLVLEARQDRVLLDNIAVDPAQQGRGIGRALIGFAATEARRLGWQELQLYTHALMTENQAWYHRIGFTVIARVQENGFDRIYMAKQLK